MTPEAPALSPTEWEAARARYAEQVSAVVAGELSPDMEAQQARQSKPCLVNGLRFASCLEAGRQLGIATQTIQDCCVSRRGWAWYYPSGLTRGLLGNRRKVFARYDGRLK